MIVLKFLAICCGFTCGTILLGLILSKILQYISPEDSDALMYEKLTDNTLYLSYKKDG